MNIWKISIQNIKSKPLYSLLSIFLLSLSIALLLGIQQLKISFKHQMENNLGDIDLVVGAKGSPLQLVLSSILHLDNPTGNIPYKEVKNLVKNRMIKRATPISYGDNYKGFRIIGSTPGFLDHYNAEIKKGDSIQKSMEVLLGYSVAEKLKLDIGDTFLSSHGLIDNEIDIHDKEFIVVGILKDTQKVVDKLIITKLESIWDVHNHEAHDDHNSHEVNHDDDDHDDHDDRKITSLLITFRTPSALLTLPRKINENTNMQAALPKYELDKLYKFTGIGFKTISWIAYIILFISGITIFISLYRMIKERAFDLAILRTYGATNTQMIKMVTYEGLIIVFFAFIIGLLITKIGLYFIFSFAEIGNGSNILHSLPISEITKIIRLVFIMFILSVSLAIYPILKMNISTILNNEK